MSFKNLEISSENHKVVQEVQETQKITVYCGSLGNHIELIVVLDQRLIKFKMFEIDWNKLYII